MAKDKNIISFSQWKNKINSPEMKLKTGTQPDRDKESAITSKTFKQLLVDFSNKTSLTSINFIKASYPLPVKLIWTLLTLTALSFNIYHIHVLYEYYAGWPTQTELSLSYNSLPLPDITICNTNPVRKSTLYQMPKNVQSVINDRDPTGNLSAASNKKKRSATTDAYGSLYQETEQYKNDSRLGEMSEASAKEMEYDFKYCSTERKVREKSGHQIDDMLLDCSFRGRKCKPQMFTVTQNKDYGNCYTISRNSFLVQKSGPSEGIKLELLLETFEYLPMTSGYGARIQIHEPGTATLPTEEGFFVSGNSETNIGLYLVNITRLGMPYGSCEEGLDFKKKYGVKYSRQVCRKMCEITKLLDKCSCYDSRIEELSLRINKSASPCTTNTDMKCLFNLEDESRKNADYCQNCESPCHEVAYQKSLSSRMWPTVSYMKFLIGEICNKNKTKAVCTKLREQEKQHNYSDLSQNFIKLNIYYEDLNYQEVLESPAYQDIEFYSDMGGAIGLWVGLSILSLCEVGQLLLEVVILLWSKCCGTRTKSG